MLKVSGSKKILILIKQKYNVVEMGGIEPPCKDESE